jgi:hypothetical protein
VKSGTTFAAEEPILGTSVFAITVTLQPGQNLFLVSAFAPDPKGQLVESATATPVAPITLGASSAPVPTGTSGSGTTTTGTGSGTATGTTTPAQPTIEVPPSTGASVKTTTYTIEGQSPAGATARIWPAVKQSDGTLAKAGSTYVGQMLVGSNRDFAIEVGLVLGENLFVASAVDLTNPSAPAESPITPVPTITQQANVKPMNKAVTTIAIHRVFELLRREAELGIPVFTERGYPLMRRVRAELEKEGYAPPTPEYVHERWDDWVHDRIEEEVNEIQELTEDILYEIFQELETADMTADRRYPLRDAVNRRLADRRYAQASAPEIREAWDRYAAQTRQQGSE